MFPVAGAILAHMDAFYMGTIRYALAAVIFLVLLAMIEGGPALALGDAATRTRLFIYGSLGFAGFSFLAFLGQSLAGTSGALVASIIMALMPFLTVLCSWVLKGVRPTSFALGAVGVALAGVLLVVTKGNPAAFAATGVSVWGDILILLGALCWVLYTMGGSTFPSWSPLRYTALSCALGTISMIVITAAATSAGWLHAPSVEATLVVWPQLAYMVLIAAVMAVFSWNAGIRILTPINGILFINLVPVTTFTITAIQGKPIEIIQVIGAGLTIVALIANNLDQRRRAARATVSAGPPVSHVTSSETETTSVPVGASS
jgi:drug/metabolite transporter (DMT)-like permease